MSPTVRISTTTAVTLSCGAVDVKAADFNGDGVDDLLVAMENRIGVLLSDGQGGFRSVWQALTRYSNEPECIAVGDINKDGLPDFVYSDTYGNTPYLNLGNGSFAPLPSFGLPTGRLAMADLNGDGAADVVVASGKALEGSASGVVQIWMNSGDGTFVLSTYSPGLAAFGICTADVNGDGSPDLLVGDMGEIAVLLNNGYGAFSTPLITRIGTFAEKLVVADFNGDGIMDVAAGGKNTNSAILLGKGDGAFGASIPLQISPYFALCAGDFNGDGRIDLAATANYLSIQYNNGDGTFSAPTTSSGWVSGLASGNFYRDGAAGLAVGYDYGNLYGSVTLSEPVKAGLGDGAYSATAWTEDIAGNVSAINSTTFQVATARDTFSVAAADVTNVGGTDYHFTIDYSGNLPLDMSTLAGANISVTGTKRIGSIAFVSAVTSMDRHDVTATYSLVPPEGSWDASDNGGYDIWMGSSPARDIAGNTADATLFPAPFTVRCIAPPASLILSPLYDTGISNTDGITRNNNRSGSLQFTVYGTTPGAGIYIYANDIGIGSLLATSTTTVVNGDRATVLPDGVYQVTARQIMSGTVSDPSPPFQMTIDTAPPTEQPGALQLDAASDTGISSSDGITNSTNLIFHLSNLSNLSFLILRGTNSSTPYLLGDTYVAMNQPAGTWNYKLVFTDVAGNPNGGWSTLADHHRFDTARGVYYNHNFGRRFRIDRPGGDSILQIGVWFLGCIA